MSTSEITWRSAHPYTRAELITDKAFALASGYIVHVWPDVNLRGEPVELTRIATKFGATVALYETTKPRL